MNCRAVVSGILLASARGHAKTLRVRPHPCGCGAPVQSRPARRLRSGADDEATAKLIDEVAAQQTKIVENQAALDEKIAAVAEEVRQARLFVARGGGNRK